MTDRIDHAAMLPLAQPGQRPARLRAFFYPMRAGPEAMRHYPYASSMALALGGHFQVVNASAGTVGIAGDLQRFARSADVLFLNWPEIWSGRHGAEAFCRLVWAKLEGRILVWTHHNVEPHEGGTLWSRWWMAWLTRFADHIVIHTQESRRLLQLRPGDRRVIEFFHPCFRREVSLPAPEREKQFDVLLWGTMREGKGVREFLEHLKQAGALPRLKVKVAGKFRRPEDHAALQALYGPLGVDVEDRFMEEADLDELHRRARCVLFAYNGPSVLNSGALLTSLPRGTPILGPDVGAFREAAQRGLIRTFRDFDEALALLDRRPALAYPHERIREFVRVHTWENLVALAHARISGGSGAPAP